MSLRYWVESSRYWKWVSQKRVKSPVTDIESSQVVIGNESHRNKSSHQSPILSRVKTWLEMSRSKTSQVTSHRYWVESSREWKWVAQKRVKSPVTDIELSQVVIGNESHKNNSSHQSPILSRVKSWMEMSLTKTTQVTSHRYWVESSRDWEWVAQKRAKSPVTDIESSQDVIGNESHKNESSHQSPILSRVKSWMETSLTKTTQVTSHRYWVESSCDWEWVSQKRVKSPVTDIESSQVVIGNKSHKNESRHQSPILSRVKSWLEMILSKTTQVTSHRYWVESSRDWEWVS